MAQKILFVCSGNTCRSPLAEALAKKVVVDLRMQDIEVGSAGSGARDGSAASDGALLIGIERGLDLAGHRARSLTRDLVDQADLILAMGQQHLVAVNVFGYRQLHQKPMNGAAPIPGTESPPVPATGLPFCSTPPR